MRYFIVNYIRRPDPRRGSDQMDETVSISKKVKMRDWQTASIILDFREQKVLQAHMDGNVIPRDWDRIVGYYYRHHAKVIEQLFEANGHPISIVVDPVRDKKEPDAAGS